MLLSFQTLDAPWGHQQLQAREWWKWQEVHWMPQVTRGGGLGLTQRGWGGKAALRAQMLVIHPLVRLQSAGTGILRTHEAPAACEQTWELLLKEMHLLLGDSSEPSASTGWKIPFCRACYQQQDMLLSSEGRGSTSCFSSGVCCK